MNGKISKMTPNKIISTALLTLFLALQHLFVLAQDSKTLFSVGKNDVTVSEFKYIYEKNNKDNASYTKESLEEYLDLYSNFKLKVQRAKELGLHEKDSYKKELEGYRRQLADSYVIDKEVIDQIVDDIYERKKYDMRVSHILVSVKRKSPKETIDEALKKVALIEKSLKQGMKFEEAVKLYSEDKNSVDKAGGATM